MQYADTIPPEFAVVGKQFKKAGRLWRVLNVWPVLSARTVDKGKQQTKTFHVIRGKANETSSIPRKY